MLSGTLEHLEQDSNAEPDFEYLQTLVPGSLLLLQVYMRHLHGVWQKVSKVVLRKCQQTKKLWWC